MVTLNHYLILSILLFSIGTIGVLLRRNTIIVLMSLELMFNSINITLVAFSYYLSSMAGRIFVVFVITIAAAEVAIGLAILINIFRLRKTVNVDELNLMKG
ncbi:MAG: NADH-quinone oxidoreductase subunit NuoK [Thermodesulfobacteriota bacterium]